MRTVIDVNDELLDAAMRELGTTTKKDTINEALRLAAERGTQARELLAGLWGQDITNPEVMKDARR